jgi:hypothetical protein
MDRRLAIWIVSALAVVLIAPADPTIADDPAAKSAFDVPPPAWPNSPFLNTVDGVTGMPIPHLCRSGGSTFQLGDTVCMNTHLGVQLARCDLLLNTTSWVPIGVPCNLNSGR